MLIKGGTALGNNTIPICPSHRYDTMLECWSEKGQQRPTFAKLKSKFDKLLLQNNHYIQFSSYAATTSDNPPGYDHLPPPSVSVDQAQTNGVTQTAVHADKAKPVATKTLSAPLVDHTDNRASVGDGVPRSSSNSYVETPTAIINSRFRVSGASDAAVRGGDRKRAAGARGAKRVIHERKRRVNTETRRTAHLKVTRVAVQPTISVEGYDHLDPIEERDGSVEASEAYDHFPSTQI